MIDDMSRAQFRAAFPAIQSAIKVCGDGTGMRVQLDIPESEMAEAVKLLQWRQTVLVVTVEPETCRDLKHAAEKGSEGSDPEVDSRRVAIRRDKRAGS